MTRAELDSFNMNYTKQILSGKPSGRRKPVLVSRVRSEPWRPAGAGGASNRPVSQGSRERDPFCSVCLNEDLSETELEVRRELEREVKLIQSKPSVAYRKHSPNNWTQEHMMDDVRKHKKLQQKKLEELKREYAEIEKRCKSKLIDDLAGFDYKESEDKADLGNKVEKTTKKTIKSRSINIEIMEDGTVKTSKIMKSKSDPTQGEGSVEDDDSVAKSITISINSSKSSRKNQPDLRKKEEHKKVGEATSGRITSDDEDCDTLNAVENLSVQEAETSQSLLLEENNSIKNENEALRKKYKKYKTLKSKIAQSNIESDRQKSELRSLKAEMVRVVAENSQLRNEISHQQQTERKLTRQHSIFETPVRDVTYQDQGVQASVLDKDIQSFEIDYFTEVIIDELKKEIRELKDKVDSNTGKEQNNFKLQEQHFLSKLNKMKEDTERMKAAASKSRELTSESSEVEKLRVEAENLRLLLSQERDTTATFENYLNLLRQSYTTMFGDIK